MRTLQKKPKKPETLLKKKRSFKNIGLLYISPWLLGFVLLQLYPMLSSLYYSFTNYSMGKTHAWVGLKNYINIFTRDPNFYQSAKVTVIYVLVAVPLKLSFALFIAVLLNQKLRGINFFRTAYYIPSILAGSISIAILWKALFIKDGFINSLLAMIGIPAISWYGTRGMALFTVCILTMWQFGSSMVLFLAGLQQIPSTLYEAAQMDGAGPVRRFFKITLPMLTPTIFFNVIMQTINAFQEYTSAAVITHGGPVYGTYLYGLKLYEEAFTNWKMGYASALSWVLFAVVMIFTLIMFATSSKWVYYEDGGVFDA